MGEKTYSEMVPIQTRVTLPEEAVAEIERLAEEERRSMSNMITVLVQEAVEARKRP